MKRYFGTSNPIGRRIGFGSDPGTPTPIEIVGVVKDAKYTDVRDETQEQLFFPYFEQGQPGGFTAFVRSTRDAGHHVRRVARNDARAGSQSAHAQPADAGHAGGVFAEPRTNGRDHVDGVRVLATLLAVIGLYGVMAYTVSRRTREIGIRMALGARVASIGWLVIREVLTIAAIGITVGLPAAWFLSRYVTSQLYGVQPTDPLTIAGAVLLLAAVATIAGLIPSVRATRVSPTTALRYE